MWYMLFYPCGNILKCESAALSISHFLWFVSDLTPCQVRQQSSHGLLGEFVPKCKSDGSYEPIQCREGYCWCVDVHGREMNGTKMHSQKPTCPAQTKSGEFDCTCSIIHSDCLFGFMSLLLFYSTTMQGQSKQLVLLVG